MFFDRVNAAAPGRRSTGMDGSGSRGWWCAALPIAVLTLVHASGEVGAQNGAPDIPEPMVFDLVRPLGAKKGELEANVLGLIPLRRRAQAIDQVPDPLGLVPQSRRSAAVELSPEIEYAVRDGLALEFEMPLEKTRIAALKPAVQWTFGTAFNNRFIHGIQVIMQYEFQPRLWAPTAVYIAGLRIDRTWSVMGIVGARGEIGEKTRADHTELLANLNIFADLNERLTTGLELNFGQLINGGTALLLMPQAHYELKDHWILQGGVGARVTRNLTTPDIAFRVIREF